MKYGENHSENKILKQYEKIAYNTKPLEKNEEFELLKKYKTKKCQESKNKIINAYLRTVLAQARKFGERNNLSIIDLIHSGVVGICNSLDAFDLSKYTKQGGLLSYYIHRGVLMELTLYYRTFLRQFSVPDNVNTKLLNINKLFKSGKLNLGNDDQKKYIGTMLSVSSSRTDNLLSLFKPSVELDKKIEDENGNGDSRASEASEYKDLILKTQNESSPDSILSENDNYENLFSQINNLEPEERSIIIHRYGINCKEHTLLELGKKYKMSPANAGLKVNKIQEKLKRLMVRNG